MAVISVTELPESEGSTDRLYRRYYSRTYLINCDSRYDGPVTIGSDSRVPHIGNPYDVSSTEKDPGTFVEKVTITRLKLNTLGGVKGCYWKLKAEYGPYDANTFGPNPLEWPLRISVGFIKEDKVVWETVFGDPIVNSAGQRFVDPVVVDSSRPFLRVIRNEVAYDPGYFDTYTDRLNSDVFLGREPYTWKVASAPAEIQYSPVLQAYYAEVTYEFQFDPNKWKKIIVDQGFCELDGSNNLQAILDAKGQPLTEAALLDGAGAKLAHGATPTFLDFDVYSEVAFSSFGFDFSNVPGLKSF